MIGGDSLLILYKVNLTKLKFAELNRHDKCHLFLNSSFLKLAKQNLTFLRTKSP
jgi:hypothetical protein